MYIHVPGLRADPSPPPLLPPLWVGLVGRVPLCGRWRLGGCSWGAADGPEKVSIQVSMYAYMNVSSLYVRMHACIHACMPAEIHPTQNRSFVVLGFINVGSC